MLRHLVFWQHIREYKCLPILHNRHFKEKQVHLHFRCKILSSGWWSELITFICRVATTYLQGSLLGCWAPQSTALSLALTGKSHQVWKLGVLVIGILKKSYLSAVREKCLLRVHSHRFVFRGKERWTNQMEVKHIQSFDVTRSKMWYNLGTDLGLEKLLVCPSTY